MSVEKNSPTEADDQQQEMRWHKVADAGELDDGQVTACPAGLRTVAVTKLHSRYGAIDNRCPHQGLSLIHI